MSGTRNEAEELRDGIQEVEDLRDEEEEDGLAEVAEDAYDGKGHAGEVAEGVPHKYTRWEPGSIGRC